MQTIAGYTFQEILSSRNPEVEHWKAIGDKGIAEVFLLPEHWKNRIEVLPKRWNAFCDFDLHYVDQKLAIIVPGLLQQNLMSMRQKLSPQSAVLFFWHIASALALLHDTGGAHGMLHLNSIG